MRFGVTELGIHELKTVDEGADFGGEEYLIKGGDDLVRGAVCVFEEGRGAVVLKGGVEFGLRM